MWDRILNLFGLCKKPTLVGAWEMSEAALRKLDISAYIIEDTEDWNDFDPDDAGWRLKEIKKIYFDAHFHLGRFRDAVNLARQHKPR